MKIIVFLLMVLSVSGCIGKTETSSEKISDTTNTELSGNMIADTIIYDVIIKSTNPEDDWERQRLQYVHQNAFIDSLFTLVYHKKIIAYDVFENKALTVNQVKSIEKQADYTRDRIGKIQFTERWYFDTSGKKIQKEILSIALGYETYDEEGEIRAYKPVFRLYLR